MIKQVYLVRYRERFGYANTLEEAKALEKRFEASFNSVCNSVCNSIYCNRKEGK